MASAVDDLLAKYAENYPGFAEQLETLKEDHLGQFAIVTAGKVTNIFITEEEALAHASGDSVVFEIGHHQLRSAVLM